MSRVTDMYHPAIEETGGEEKHLSYGTWTANLWELVKGVAVRVFLFLQASLDERVSNTLPITLKKVESDYDGWEEGINRISHVRS